MEPAPTGPAAGRRVATAQPGPPPGAAPPHGAQQHAWPQQRLGQQQTLGQRASPPSYAGYAGGPGYGTPLGGGQGSQIQGHWLGYGEPASEPAPAHPQHPSGPGHPPGAQPYDQGQPGRPGYGQAGYGQAGYGHLAAHHVNEGARPTPAPPSGGYGPAPYAQQDYDHGGHDQPFPGHGVSCPWPPAGEKPHAFPPESPPGERERPSAFTPPSPPRGYEEYYRRAGQLLASYQAAQHYGDPRRTPVHPDDGGQAGHRGQDAAGEAPGQPWER